MPLFSSSLSSSWHSISQMWSHSFYEPDQHISMQNCFSIIGAGSSIPDTASPLTEGDYGISGSMFGLNHNYNDSLITQKSGYSRRMISGSALGDWCNTFYITYAGSHNITAYNDGNTVITKNGSTLHTLTSRGSAVSSTFAIGDQIHASQPVSIGQGSYPGQLGAYAGYAGYCFASRRDRHTIVFYLQNLSFQNNANVQIMYTSTSDSNVTSMTGTNITLTKGGTANTGNSYSYSTSTTGNYFILSDQPICVWRGSAPTNDCMPLYPLSSEILYGWYSSNGHTFAVNNAQITRTDSGGGGNVNGRSSANGLQSGVCVLDVGADNAYASDGVTSTLTGGSYFTGNCTAIFEANALGLQSGSVLIGAESQADGNGSEMTPFTGRYAHGRFTMTGGLTAWNAFVSSGYSGSTPSPLTGWGDVIMRFNKSDVFQDAQSFTGQNSNAPHSSKAYFGNGLGTGVAASAGDYFLCNVPVQGYMDTDSTDKDETVMIMTNDFDYPPATTHLIQCDVGNSGDPGIVQGWGSALIACQELGDGFFTQLEVYSPSTTLDVGVVLFWDEGYLHPVNGNRKYYGTGAGRSYSEYQLDYNGMIMDEPDAC